MKLEVLSILVGTVACACAAGEPYKDNLQYVNPFIGTDGQTESEYGGMIPSTGIQKGRC
jgi:hypothetical protein